MDARKPKVLVIDDDKMLADTLTEILSRHGFSATALYSGEQAIEFVDGYRPDIVLSDIRMRRVDGIEAAKHIRQMHPECRVILFTASAVNSATKESIREMGFEFLQRPLHPDEVLNALRERSQGIGSL